jgi:formate dehydrogenase subunit delta
MDADKLVMMANQIASFHRRQSGEKAAIEVAAHIQRFWEPRMRAAGYAILDAGGEGLSDIAREALTLARAHDKDRLPFDPYQAASITPPLEA